MPNHDRLIERQDAPKPSNRPVSRPRVVQLTGRVDWLEPSPVTGGAGRACVAPVAAVGTVRAAEAVLTLARLTGVRSKGAGLSSQAIPSRSRSRLAKPNGS